MNIDDAVRVMPHKILSQDLHVAGQHDEADVAALQFRQGRLLLLTFGFGSHWKYHEFQPMALHQILQVRMIAHDQREIGREFTRLTSVKQVLQTVVIL